MIIVPNTVADDLMRTTQYTCYCWQLRRQDKETFRVTNHNEEVPFDGAVFDPGATLDIGDITSGSAENPDNAEAVSTVGPGWITSEDVDAGRWRLCRVTQFLVNWKYPWRGALHRAEMSIQDMEWTDQGWRAQLHGLAHLLGNRIGVTMGIGCKNIFGAAFGTAADWLGCRFDVEGDSVRNVQIDTVQSQRIIDLNPSDLASTSDDHWTLGTVEFSTGRNEGVAPIIISGYVDLTRQVSLEQNAPYPLAVGDRLTIRRGCNKDFDGDCTKYGEQLNHRAQLRPPTEASLTLERLSRQ